MNLYRFISFEGLMSLLVYRKERYVRPTVWEDNYEGYLFSHMDNEDDVRQIVTNLYYDVSPRNYNAVSTNFFRMWHKKWWSYAQCWSKLDESDAMWRIYSYNNHSVRLRTTKEAICNNLDQMLEKGFYDYIVKEVIYDDISEEDIIRKQVIQMKESKDVYEAYFHKRLAFEHEKECRVIITDQRNWLFEELGHSGVQFNLAREIAENKYGHDEIINKLVERIMKNRCNWNEGNIKEQIFISVENLSDYILGVMVNPFAEKWFVDLIKTICDEYKLNFEGQSELYLLKK